MRLYELTETYQNIFNLLEREDLQDDIALKEALDSVQDDLNTKVEGTIMMVRELEAQQNALAEEAKRFTARARAAAARTEWLKNYLKSNLTRLAELDKGFKVDTGKFKVTLSRPTPNTLILADDLDPYRLPADCQRVKVEIDKTRLKQRLKDGEVINGAFLEETRTMRIS